MASISTTHHRSAPWRLASGIVLMLLAVLMIGFGIIRSDFDGITLAISGLNFITGVAMVIASKL